MHSTFIGTPYDTLKVAHAIVSESLSAHMKAFQWANYNITTTLYSKLDLCDVGADLVLSSTLVWCPRSVSAWNFLFWLLCFATNAFNQPTGRVLGLFHPRHAVLRSMPVLYATDGVYSLLTWMGQAFVAGHGIRVGASHVLAARLVHPDGLANVDAFTGTRSHAWLRWSSFVVGVLPQYVKLLASREGMPAWVLAVEILFLIPWVVFELLTAAACPDNFRALAITARSEKEIREAVRAQETAANWRHSFPDSWLRSHLLPTFYPQIRTLH
ncbi:hypothetical protein CMQ_2733 [Grosmannia clavigera kw1407]|uniref:Uncharacterized protein n=1 Tax=Grosmannia clavigera (strain kw1407 / UAMH 11150) TaxID=655863 RepID=F0XGK3_GROCL|nr:uncharacterized protein CMQ_2733 [Grosmannia clavigera kw1407]EFX02804.1 hypothetical protein CMQ_2733 [Grosmannia clavigera kw1407]